MLLCKSFLSFTHVIWLHITLFVQFPKTYVVSRLKCESKSQTASIILTCYYTFMHVLCYFNISNRDVLFKAWQMDSRHSSIGPLYIKPHMSYLICSPTLSTSCKQLIENLRGLWIYLEEAKLDPQRYLIIVLLFWYCPTLPQSSTLIFLSLIKPVVLLTSHF